MTALEEESAALKAQLASLQQIGIHSDVDSAQEAIRRLYAALPDEQRKEMFQELASAPRTDAEGPDAAARSQVVDGTDEQWSASWQS